MNYQIIGFILGTLLTILGFAEFLPAVLDWYDGHRNAQSFFLCSIISIFFGGALLISNKDFKQHTNIRHAFLLSTLAWFFTALFSALPLYISNINISYTDAFFEAMSGVTTTGATVLSDLDNMSRGILFWRSIMQWIGGIGAIAFAVILLPYLKIGGMQLFKTESSASEKPMARISVLISSLLYVYIGLTLACAITYKVLGMSWFDALNHAMTTIPTGGFSTHDASFGFFTSSPLFSAAMIFMILSALPFILYVKFFFQRKDSFATDEQLRALALILGVFITLMTLWLWLHSDHTVFTSFGLASFNIVSIVTTTGYYSTDYTAWSSFSMMFFFFLTYVGGCAGSTAGGLKIMRVIILYRVVLKHLKTLIYPHGVFVTRYQMQTLSDKNAMIVLGFTGLYVASNVLLTIALTFFSGLDFITAVSAAAAALANVGPGVGNIIGPDGSYAPLNASAKWLLAGGMLAGRLEILTVAILFFHRYWGK